MDRNISNTYLYDCHFNTSSYYVDYGKGVGYLGIWRHTFSWWSDPKNTNHILYVDGDTCIFHVRRPCDC